MVPRTGLGSGRAPPSHSDDAQLRALLYVEYYARRRALARPPSSAPPWCNPFESAFLWMGGCHPSMFISLLHSLSSSGVEALVVDGPSAPPRVGLSAAQPRLVNELHLRTVREEDRLTGRMAALHERLPVVRVRQWWRKAAGGSPDARSGGGEGDGGVRGGAGGGGGRAEVGDGEVAADGDLVAEAASSSTSPSISGVVKSRNLRHGPLNILSP